MHKPVIGVTQPFSPIAVGDAYHERLLFNYDGLGRQANPVIRAAYVAPENFEAGARARGTGAQAQSGFECVTLVRQGQIESRDSTGHVETLDAGDILWRGAGRGVLHENRHGEAIVSGGGTLELLTLWINLPAMYKQVEPYRQLIRGADVPVLPLPDEAGTARVIAGEWLGQTGPAETVTPLQLWDLDIVPGKSVKLPLPRGWYAFVLVLSGDASTPYWQRRIGAPQLMTCDRFGTEVDIATEGGARVVLVSGSPLDETIVGKEALVMNTREQLDRVEQELALGAFGNL
jgi:redox-sensitive bicupin YhaK (pirin superfamily)